MSVVALIICVLFLAAVWRVQLPDGLSRSADVDRHILSAEGAGRSWLRRRGRESSLT